jgi:hypothetical protein
LDTRDAPAPAKSVLRSGKGERSDGEDVTAFGFLDEDDGVEVCAVPVFAEIEGGARGEGDVFRGIGFAEMFEAADDVGVIEGVALVFAARDVGVEIVLGDGEKNLGGIAAGDFAEFAEADFEDGAGIAEVGHVRRPMNIEIGLGGFHGAVDCTQCRGAVVADEFGGAVHDHLRGVGAVVGEAGAVGGLARGGVGGRVGIAPALLVPIIHVVLEGDDLRAGDRLRLDKAGEERVGGRAVGAAFGGEELDEDGRARGWSLRDRRRLSVRGPFRGRGEHQRGEGEKTDCETASHAMHSVRRLQIR